MFYSENLSNMKFNRRKRRWVKRAKKQGISLQEYALNQLLKKLYTLKEK